MKKLTTLLWTSSILISLSPSASAGIISGDYYNLDDKSKYSDYAFQTKFTYVGKLFIADKNNRRDNNNACTGTLIQPDSVLTSGHCLYGDKEQFTSLVGKFNSDILGLGGVANVVDAVVYKDWKTTVDFGYDNRTRASVDLALVKLDRNLPLLGSIPLPIPSAQVIQNNFTASFAGYGMQGDGSTGRINGTAHTTLLGGENIAQVLPNGVFSYDLDDGAKVTTNIDRLSNVPLEFIPTSGDSGAPVYSGNQLVGVHSRSGSGRRCLSSGSCFDRDKGEYGSIGFATPLEPYVGWITNVIDQLDSLPSAAKPYSSKGFKLRFAAGNEAFSDWDALDVTEVDDREFSYEFDLTLDTFSEAYNEEIFQRVFMASSTPQKPTEVPEPLTILGSVVAGTFGVLLHLKNKQQQYK